MHRAMLDKSQVTEPAAIFGGFDACAECNAISRSIHRSEIAAHAEMEESQENAVKATQESNLGRTRSARIEITSCADKAAVHCQSDIRFESGEMFFQNGSGDISNESGEQGLSISRLHSHEALSRHGVHTSRVIFCEEFAFVADKRLCMEFEGFTHCLRDPAFQHKLAA